MTEFGGFPEAGLRFLADLRSNNNREWFNEHKSIYRDSIVEPALSFIVTLGEQLRSVYPDLNFDTRTNGAGSLMRIYRDTRFSKDKTPYKSNVGIVLWHGEGKKMERPGFYFHMEPEGAWIGGGWHVFPKPVLEAFREAVAHADKGTAFQAALSELEGKGYEIWGERYQRVPTGYAQDHPRADLLKYKGVFAKSRDFTPAELTSADLVQQCFDVCARQAVVQRWLLENL